MEVQEIREEICELFSRLGVEAAEGCEALITVAAMVAGQQGVDNRKQAADLYAEMWQMAYSDTH